MREFQFRMIGVGLVLSTSIVAAAESASQAPAERLSRLLAKRKLQAFATELSSTPGRFAAVLYFPGVQMLTILATYPVPRLLRERVSMGEYREAYSDLSTAAERQGRLFVEDFGEPGLRATRNGEKPFDITWRNQTEGVKYDGAWLGQKLSEDEYRRRYEADDAEYADALNVLIKALEAPPSGGELTSQSGSW